MDTLFSKVLVINMDDSPERYARVTSHMQAQGTHDIQRVSAVDGRALDSQAKQGSCTTYCRTMCTPSMIGCFLSHKRAWGMVEDNALICEDDVVFTPQAVAQTREAMQELPEGWDMMFLGCFTCDSDINKEDTYITRMLYPHRTATQVSEHLWKPAMVFGMHAYAVSRQGAAKLQQLLPLASNHVDWALSEHLDELDVFTVRPGVAYQTGMDGSTMGGKAPVLINRILTEIPIGAHAQDGRTMAWLCSEAWCQLGPAWMTVNKYFVTMLVLSAVGYPHIAASIIMLDLLVAGVAGYDVLKNNVLLGYLSLFVAVLMGCGLRYMH